MHFTIDTENILTVHDTAPAAGPDAIALTPEKDLKKATAVWPIARLVEVWNGFAGEVLLGNLKPVKKFTDRATALKRIWTAMRRLEEHFNEETQSRPAAKAAAVGHRWKAKGEATAATQAPASTPAAVTPAASPVPAPGPTVRKRRAGTQAAAVIALLERAGGATLEEIGKATGWQKHTIRGFVSALGKKHG